ncbi:MAG: CHASE2 domain-containing protein [Aphanocapsa sp. GSE-SYN-MK-11-07L]|jgi:CHASE2 domain-containing sensor protein/tRNA A-37 threonylcarbamoyl transferase component Bud32|nr:CHASE2 domain-containing protein [Aphanocapsa sp. GSE-SYN-MK-11-07L]
MNSEPNSPVARKKKTMLLLGWRMILGISLGVAASILGLRQLGILERAELSAFDLFVRWHSHSAPDDRLLIVAVTEEDIEKLGKSDQTLNLLLTKLEQYQPQSIGLDIYRDLPSEPGHIELLTTLQVSNNTIAVCQASSNQSTGVGPPATVPPERLGFSDIVVDFDGLVRRNLLALTPDPNSKCQAASSFALQLALQYLGNRGLNWQKTPEGHLLIGSTRFSPLEKQTGGYQSVDSRGYQILLNYSSPQVAQQVSMSQVLAGNINPSWVKDRIVLIGVTALSGNDFFFTPYTAGQQNFRMAGVEVHAQMVSQILSAVLDRRPLIWVWPEAVELIWVWVWVGLGTLVASTIRRPFLLLLVGGGILVGLGGVCYLLFIQGGWVPLVPAALGFAAAIVCVISWQAYRSNHDHSGPVVSSDPVDNGQAQASQPQLLQGRYQMMEPLHDGQGGFGKTYLAKDTQRPGHPDCIVKQLKPRMDDQLTHEKHEQRLKIARTLFCREAETLERLGKHPQIPQLLAYFEQDQEFYLVQEFISGLTLESMLSPQSHAPQAFSEFQVVNMLMDLLLVLEFVHNCGVIHRDLKPANIIHRTSDQRFVLIDFGAVKLLQNQLLEPEVDTSTIIIGSTGYAAPEQFQGHPKINSDIYALGMIGIQALTGKLPAQIKRDKTTKALFWSDGAVVSHQTATILNKMVQYEFEDRYLSAAAVIEALANLNLK